MTTKRSDLLLWVGLATLGWCGALALHKQLALIRKTAEVVQKNETSSDKINQATQDGTPAHSDERWSLTKASSAIKLSTLHQLAESSSFEIKYSSIKIICERGLQNATVWKILRRDLASKDFESRDRALTILLQTFPDNLHANSSLVEHIHFLHPSTHTAVVKCLCNMLPAAREAEYLHTHHNSSEADALWLMQKLIEQNIEQALKAGVVRKWLSQYPINVRAPQEEKKAVIRDMIKAYEYDDDYERLLCSVLRDINTSEEARWEMEKCGIGDPGYIYTGRTYTNSDAWTARRYHPSSGSYIMLNDDLGIDTDEDVPWVEGGEPGPAVVGDNIAYRRREESDEEMALRRRRREAMVFAENGRPITREDIIEREEVIADEEVEEELEQLMEEMEAEMGPDDPDEDEGWVGWLSRIRPNGLMRARTSPPGIELRGGYYEAHEREVERQAEGHEEGLRRFNSDNPGIWGLEREQTNRIAPTQSPDDLVDYPRMTQESLNARHRRDWTIPLMPLGALGRPDSPDSLFWGEAGG